MEERRIREIARVVEGASEQHADDPQAFTAYLERHGASRTDVAEALADVERLGDEEAEGVASMLRVALERIANGRRATG